MTEFPSAARTELARLARGLLDVVMPPRCLSCGVLVAAPGTLCPECWAGLRFLLAPCCAVCGLPFETDLGPDALCAACAGARPHFARSRAVLAYDDASRGLVLRFKHADHTGAAPAFARWMARAGADLVTDAQLVVPVPLHRWRLLYRRYNQSALLAHALGRQCALPVAADALRRIRATPSQGMGGRLWRARNVDGAFAVVRPDRVAGKRVLLVDDVETSGATLDECARVLLASGASAVDALTLARVLPAGP